MPVIEGAEPFAADGDDTGVLLIHGFTGNPISMRPWADELAAAGLSVRLPRLPGHGTRWQELNATRWPDWYAEVDRSFDLLTARCTQVFVAGLSMGGTLALRLAEQRRDQVAGLMLVNPSLNTEDRRAALVPLLSTVLASMPPIGNDIAKPGVSEQAYDRLPLKAAASLRGLWKLVLADLALVTAPVLVFRSAQDHVVPASSLALLRQRATGTTITERVLTQSFHVATLDYDAPQIFAESLEFIRGLVRVPAP